MHVAVPVPEHGGARGAAHQRGPRAVVHVQAAPGPVPPLVAGLPVDAEFGQQVRLVEGPPCAGLVLDLAGEVGGVSRLAVHVGHGEVDLGNLPGRRIAVGRAHEVPVGVVAFQIGRHLAHPGVARPGGGDLVPELPGEQVGEASPPGDEVSQPPLVQLAGSLVRPEVGRPGAGAAVPGVVGVAHPACPR